MEQYHIITRGRCVKNQPSQVVAANLIKNKIPERHVSKLMSGQITLIKQGQTWTNAKRLQEKLRQMGLITELRLQLNPEVFQLGLLKLTPGQQLFVSDSFDKTPEQDKQPPLGAQYLARVWGMERNIIAPALVSIPKKSILLSGTARPIRHLVSRNFYWNPLALLVSGLVIGIVLQGYLLKVMTQYWHWQSLATVIGLIFLLLAAVCIPRLLQPRTVCFCHDESEGLRLFLVETAGLMLGSKGYQVMNEEAEVIASIDRKFKSAAMSIVDGRAWTWNPKTRFVDIEGQAVDMLQDGIISDSLLGNVLDGVNYLAALGRFFAPKPKFKQINWDKYNYRLVLDGTNKPVAQVFTEPMPAVRLLSEELSTSDQVLAILFAAAIIRPGLA